MKRLSEPCARERSPIKSMKIRFQQLPKTIQKPSQIHPKTFQNRDLEGVPLEIVFRSQFFPLLARAGPPLGGVLGCSWAVLWRLGRVLGTSRDALGASWAVLGASCSILCLSWGVLRIVFGKTSWKSLILHPKPVKCCGLLVSMFHDWIIKWRF